jgi:hypothetical protein
VSWLGASKNMEIKGELSTTWMGIYDPYDTWLVVWNMFHFSIYWEESSQLTNPYFSGGPKPPTRYRLVVSNMFLVSILPDNDPD